MIRRSTLLWLLAAIIVGSGLYQLKYEVQAKEERLTRLNRQIQAEQEAIHVLNAEWAFLNRPDRLAELAGRHLEMNPVAPAQFTLMGAIPQRPVIQVALEAGAAAPVPGAPQQGIVLTTAAAPPTALTHATPAHTAPAVLKVAAKAPAKPVPAAPKAPGAEARHSLGTISSSQLQAVTRSAGRDVVVVVDGAQLARAQR
jgi:hypothetical protein